MTASRPDISLPIDVHGELRLEGPGPSPVTLTAQGSQLRLAAPGWVSLGRLGPRSLLAQRRLLSAATVVLKKARLTVNVSVDGRPAFAIGDGVRTTLLARLLGLTSTNLRFSDVLSLLRSRAATRHADRR